MKRTILIVMVTSATLLLGACANTVNLHKNVPLLQGPAIRNVTGPYDAAKACVSALPETRHLIFAVGAIRDVTGRMSVVGNGNGSFMPLSATAMMESSLATTGVTLINISGYYRNVVNWYGAKGLENHSRLYIPDYLVKGSIDALDFLPGSAASFDVAGVEHHANTYRAVGRADFSLATFPYTDSPSPGGLVVATTQVSKQFTAVDQGGGVGEFVGGGKGARYASFSLDKGNREPMQYAVGYMTDYAAVELVTDLLERKVHEGRMPKDLTSKIRQCRKLLNPAS